MAQKLYQKTRMRQWLNLLDDLKINLGRLYQMRFSYVLSVHKIVEGF